MKLLLFLLQFWILLIWKGRKHKASSYQFYNRESFLVTGPAAFSPLSPLSPPHKTVAALQKFSSDDHSLESVSLNPLRLLSDRIPVKDDSEKPSEAPWDILFSFANTLRVIWRGPPGSKQIIEPNDVSPSDISKQNTTSGTHLNGHLSNVTTESPFPLSAKTVTNNTTTIADNVKTVKNISSLVVLSPIEQEFRVQKSPSKTNLPIPKEIAVNMTPKRGVVQKLKDILFQRRNKDTVSGKSLKLRNVSAANGSKGIAGYIQTTFRRRILNLLDRSPQNWARAVSSSHSANSKAGGGSEFLVTNRKMLSSSSSMSKESASVKKPKSLPAKIGNAFLRTAVNAITAPVRIFVVDDRASSKSDQNYELFNNEAQLKRRPQQRRLSSLDDEVWMLPSSTPSPPPPPPKETTTWVEMLQSFSGWKKDTSEERNSRGNYFEENIQFPAKTIPFSRELKSFQANLQFPPSMLRSFSQGNQGNRSKDEGTEERTEWERSSDVTVKSLINLAIAGKEIATAAGSTIGEQLKYAAVYLPQITVVWPWERQQIPLSEQAEEFYSFPPPKESPEPLSWNPPAQIPPLAAESSDIDIHLGTGNYEEEEEEEILETKNTAVKRRFNFLKYLLPITSRVVAIFHDEEDEQDSTHTEFGQENNNDGNGMITNENNLPPEIKFDLVRPEDDFIENLSQFDDSAAIPREGTGGLFGTLPRIGQRSNSRNAKESTTGAELLLNHSVPPAANSIARSYSPPEDRRSQMNQFSSMDLPTVNPAQIIEKDGGLLQVPSSFFFSTISKTAEMASKFKPPTIDSLPSIPLPNVNPPPLPAFSSFDEFSGFGAGAEAGGGISDIAIIDKSAADGVKFGRTQDMIQRPRSLPNIPIAGTSDFNFLFFRQIVNAITGALNIKTERDGEQFMKTIGLQSLIDGIICKEKYDDHYDRVDAVKGLCRLMRTQKSVADQIGSNKEVVGVFCDMMEAPFKGFLRSFRNAQDREKELRALHEAVSLTHRMVRTSDIAVLELRQNSRLRKILTNIIQAENQLNPSPPQVSAGGNQQSFSSTTMNAATSLAMVNVNNNAMKHSKLANGTTVIIEPIQLSFEDTKAAKSYVMKKRNGTTIVEYVNLKPHQMARVSLWGLGGVPWKPKQPGQRGLRILSFDGGGTRGVLSIAYIKEIFKRLQKDHLQPHQVFDIICGTSTGGIIAMLFGAQRNSIEESEYLYDDFIGKIFSSKSNLKLVTEKALYDEREFEKILYQLCGDQLLLDSNQNECPRVFCLSTKFNSNPPQTQIWRNYNYPVGVRSRNPGTFRVNTLTAVRATTAAPTFFTPVPWEGGLYCDGALVANNPTAIAIEEARALYPDVPIELIVSIGTGVYVENNKMISSMGWDLLVNQLVASTTDTEDTHALLSNFLSPEQYYRFNPILKDNMAIDEKDKNILNNLKQVARNHSNDLFERAGQVSPLSIPSSMDELRRYDQLIRILRGKG